MFENLRPRAAKYGWRPGPRAICHCVTQAAEPTIQSDLQDNSNKCWLWVLSRLFDVLANVMHAAAKTLLPSPISSMPLCEAPQLHTASANDPQFKKAPDPDF